MRRKLIIHIGANKTGSSAIQRFLAINRVPFLEEGIVIPDNEFRVADDIQGYHVFGFQQLLDNPSEGRVRLEDALDAIDLAYPEANAILLSAENLTAHPAAPPLFENLLEKYDIQVVIYVRRQDEFILSSWQQWDSKISADFWAWIVSVIGRLGNWRVHLERWESIIPRDKITVRVYERSKLEGGDIIADFYSVLDLPKPLSAFEYPKGTINPSFSDAIMDLIKGNEMIFKNVHDGDFYNFVRSMTGNKYVKPARQSSISFLQRQSIVDKYKGPNNWVRKSYFPHVDGELFSPPEESDYSYMSSDEAERQKLEFLTTMLYQMYKRGTK